LPKHVRNINESYLLTNDYNDPEKENIEITGVDDDDDDDITGVLDENDENEDIAGVQQNNEDVTGVHQNNEDATEVYKEMEINNGLHEKLGHPEEEMVKLTGNYMKLSI